MAITKYIGNRKKVTIPGSIGGKEVVMIGREAFNKCMNLKIVVLPKGVTSIYDMAFFSCENLESITIPFTVTSIGDWAFSRCNSLTRITIPNSVTSIKDWVFLLRQPFRSDIPCTDASPWQKSI